MSVQYRNTDTLAGDHRLRSFYDLTVFYFTPDTKRFLFALLFFSSDIWMMFSTISGQSLKVLPAPEIAWYVVATTSYGSNSFQAVRTGA